jgi:hypothetical protein
MFLRVIGTRLECDAFFAVMQHPKVKAGVDPVFASASGLVELWQRILSRENIAYLLFLGTEPNGVVWFEPDNGALRAHVAVLEFTPGTFEAMKEIVNQMFASYKLPLVSVYNPARRDVSKLLVRLGATGEPGKLRIEV